MSSPDGTLDIGAEQVRVFIVDDQQLVRAGFRMLIDSQPDLRVVGEAGNGEEAVRALSTTGADVVLMDVRMPVMDGIEATARILARAADIDREPGRAPLRVVVLTTFDLDEYALQAIRAGASGFMLKDAPPAELLSAVRTVHAGDAVIAPSTTRRLLERLAPQLPPSSSGDPSPVDALTQREREVLVLMARGRSNGEIAADLVVAEATVKTHVGRVLAKLGARDRVQAVVVAYESGLVHAGESS